MIDFHALNPPEKAFCFRERAHAFIRYFLINKPLA